MPTVRLITWNLFVVSTALLCFEIISTRIASVIFVNHYAFFILSLAILGMGTGGIFAFYKLQDQDISSPAKTLALTLALLGGTLLLFIFAVLGLPFIEMPALFFTLLFLPFFLGGIFYALAFRYFAHQSFQVYAADLVGASLGSLLPIAVIPLLGPVNGVLLFSLVFFGASLSFLGTNMAKTQRITSFGILALLSLLLLFSGNQTLTGTIPIGEFREKDFHHVYPSQSVESTIMDSRWSIFGRSDLVRHSHQDQVRHLFIDGAAGSPMYRFDGNTTNVDPMLQQMLLGFSSTIPLTFLEDDARDNMLIIGPGAGKEVLAGLTSGVREITGVEINADFVQLVKDHSDFNGGIYTDFPNVQILVREGRQYVRQQENHYDIISMVLPSTQQVQNIENYALSENYLLTVEAIEDYLDLLTPEGRIITTVYNEWELKRLIVTAAKAFENRGIDVSRLPYHLLILEDDFAPTMVLRKHPYTTEHIAHRLDVLQQIPSGFPEVTYMPFQQNRGPDSEINRLVYEIESGETPLDQLVKAQPFDISASYDDSPYFYKIEKGIPGTFYWLFSGVFLFNLLVIGIPYRLLGDSSTQSKKKRKKSHSVTSRKLAQKPLLIFSLLGAGFMIVEVALFQKLTLYLGSPTISLSVLLCSLLVSMGAGSYFGNRILPDRHHFRLLIVSLAIIITGLIVIAFVPWILDQLLTFDLVYRAVITFLLLLPFGFLLGIPFPSIIQIIKDEGQQSLIPWMYGINGSMSVLGSVLAIIFSMLYGFTPAYVIGLLCYAAIAVLMLPGRRNTPHPVNSNIHKQAIHS